MTVNAGTGVHGSGSQNGGGLAAPRPPVRIDSDVLPAWETEALPDWVVHWLIPMLSAGQKWPGASESGLSKLAEAYDKLAEGSVSSAPAAGSATRVLLDGWISPTTANFVSRATFLYGHEGGLAGVSGNARAYSQQANNFAVETQYSKLSVNVAFWVTVVAIAIALFVAFFTAGSSTAIIGPYAAGARAAITRILVRLMTLGGRELSVARLARVTSLSGATGRGLIARLLASPIGRELIEEIGEEFFIDAAAQYQQLQMGTVQDWDVNKSAASIIGAGGGALFGTALAGPVARVTSHVPGFAGRALTTGLTNTIASPAGSFIANGVVYDQWQNPFTADSLLGGFMGGAGRTGTISPFNPEVYTALAHPVTSLASAYDLAAQADAGRAAGGPPGGTADGNPSGGGPANGGPQPGMPGAVRQPDPAAPTTVRAAAPAASRPDAPATPRLDAGRDGDGRRTPAVPDPDAASQRRTPRADNPDQADPGAAAPDQTDPSTAAPDQTDPGAAVPDQADPSTAAPDQGDAAPRPAGDAAPRPDDASGRAGHPSPTGQAQDGTTAPDASPAQPDSGPAQPDANPAQLDVDPARPDGSGQPDANAAQPGNSPAQPDGQAVPDAQAAAGSTQLADDGSGRPVTSLDGSAPAGQPMPASVRARTALIGALATNFPDAVIGPAGDLLISTPGGVRAISAATMGRIRSALDMRAEEVTDLSDLQAEAAAMLTVVQAEEVVQAGQPAAPAAAPAPDAAPAYTSKPGTVTSRPVPGTRYVPDGRQGPDLDFDEVHDAVAELLAKYFLGQGVTGFSWSQDGRTLAVHTATDGTHYFRPVIGGLSPKLMGETQVRTGRSEDDAHLVHFNPRVATDQLPRVWLHEITDTLHKLQEAGEGVRRSLLPRKSDGEAKQNACVPAWLNELAFLADKWQQAQTLPEKRLIAVDIDGLSRKLREHGQTPPLPPWAPTQGTRLSLAPPLLGPNPSPEDVQAVIDALVQVEQTLKIQIQSKTDSAEAARKKARQATREARKALKQHDQGRFERARKARQENRAHRATQKRHTRIAKAYGPALARATQTRNAYEQLLSAMRRTGAPTRPGEISMASIARSLANEAARRHQGYLDALSAALPQQDSLSMAMPTGPLAHHTALTTAVNKLLERHGIGHQFSPHELEGALRADFHKLVSPDGVVLRVGRGSSAAEVRVRLSLADLVEVLDPGIKASETMVGLFFQAGRTVTATESGSGGLPLGFNTAVLAQLLPEGEWARTLAEMLGVGVGVAAGRNWSATGGAGVYAQGGSVSDNRSESLLFDSAATWTVEIRTRKSDGWQDATVVDSGAPGDAAGQRLWVSHSFTDQAPRKLAWIDDAKRDDKLPNHVLTSMTGLEGALDTVAATLGGLYDQVGAIPHDQLRTFVTEELPHRLRDAVNGDLERVFTRGGKPHARVRAETRVVLVASEPIGGASAEEWEEEVLVDFAATPGGASSGGSLEASASAGFSHPALQEIDGFGSYEPSIGPRVRVSRSASQSYSATANQQAIHPSVHRKTNPKQTYRLALETTFIVEEFGKPPVRLRPMRSTAVVSMRESAAYRFGLPVDHDALVYHDGRPLLDADGNQVLRGDPRPGPPPGRKPELPSWLGDGPGQMRGAGPGLVQEIDGLAPVRQKVMDQLAERGIIPKTVDDVRQYASNPLARAAQILNLQEVTEQLSEHRIRSAYDTLAQEGIVVDLVTHGLNGAPEHHMLHISLKQDFKNYRYIGYTDSETVVNLDIGSDTSARAVSQSRTYGGGASVAESDGPDQGHDGLSHEAGVSAGGSRTRTAGSSVGSTVNVVSLHESTGPVAIFSVGHDLKVDLVHDGETTPLASGRGSARLLFAADLLPAKDGSAPAPIGKVSKKVLSRAKLVHWDAHGSLQSAAQKVQPGSMRRDSVAYQMFMAVLGVRNLVSHPRMLMRLLTTGLAVRPQGTPTRASMTVTGEVGEMEVLGVVDHVKGEILFGLGSAGVSWGGSSGHSVGASTTVSDLDGGGTSSDSGTLSLPSRSGGTSVSTSVLDIWGDEGLSIDFGRQILIRATADLTVTGSESMAHAVPLAGRVPTGENNTATAQGTGLFMLSEDDALVMYAEGELPLPGPLVGDAVERFLNGSMKLDASLAVPLVQRYIMDVAKARAAGEDVGYAARHTPQALLEKLQELTGLGPAATTAQQGNEQQQLDQMLSEATDLIDRSRDVVLAPSYDGTVGLGTVESLDLTDEQGNPVDMMEAVLNAVRAAHPEAVDGSPTLADELSVDFSSDAALIHVNDMWSVQGYEKSYHVQVGAQTAQAEEVTVTARLVYDNPEDSRRGRFLTHTSQAGVIRQRYRYTDLSHSESYNGSYSAGVNQGSADNGDGHGVGVGTDRGRSYSGSTNRQGTRLQRMAVFNGMNRVEQKMTLVIEVTRRPVRPGRIRSAARRAVDALRRILRSAPPVRYRAVLVRRIPTGMIRPVAEDPGPLTPVIDPRMVELRPGHFPDRLREHAGKPLLFDIITSRFAKMLGAATVAARRSELVKRLSHDALLTGFERMAGPSGLVVPLARQKFKDQGAQVTIRARLSDFTIVAGPFDAEKGEVDRAADAQNTTVSRGRALPVGTSGSMSDGDSGLDGGVRAGEQASESVSDHHGARRERSKFEQGKAYVVRLRVDYDLTFEHVARLRDGNAHAIGDPVHMTGATSGEIDVTLFEEEIAELRSRVESNVRLAPPVDPGWARFSFAPAEGRSGLIQILQDARLAARELGMVARVAVREADGIHRYEAAPDGSVHSETPDGGFAEAFATLPPALLDAADQAGVDLRHVFMNSHEPGTFVHQVRAELMAQGVLLADVDKSAWPADREASSPTAGGSVAQGVTPGSMSSPAIEGTPFSRSGRPDGVPDLTMGELRGQNITLGDLGGAAARVTWHGDMVTVQVPSAPDQHIRVLIGEPGAGNDAATELRAGTPDDPHIMRFWPRVHPDVVSSVLVHELSHVLQETLAAASGAPQGVIRTSLSEHQAEGTDYCLLPRLNEHAHLSRKWHATSDPATRATLADAIDAIAADLERRGHTPPAPPWGTGPRAPAVPQPLSRLARLLNGGGPVGLDTSPAGLGRLAQIAGVAGLAPAGPRGEFTVSTRSGTFTVALADAAPGATEVTVDSRAPGRLALRVPADADGRGAVEVAERIAAHAAALDGRPAGRTLGPGPVAPGLTFGTDSTAPVLGVADAATLARLRGLVRAVADGGWSGAAEALRAEAARAGLAPGQAGAAPRLLALARAGELSPADVTAIRGHATLPETAAARAVERGAALMGARVHDYGSGLLDIVLPGRPPIPVEVRPAPAGGTAGGAADGTAGVPGPGLLTVQVDGRLTIGANERAAAATAAGAIARTLGAMAAADHAALAELYEAVRQARAATARQRPARLGVLHDLLATTRPQVWQLVPQPLATELSRLADGARPRDWPAYLDRLRALANTTGWYPPEEERCRCPAGGPCECGLRTGQAPDVARTMAV
ncbi:WXG100-like domain-containing protein [Nonomuraea jabiensis]|uniref:WXG100-like domain-containing protein n=1 Tax=Nonomuraea jabiensis TaxID=882448 RepID=UPI0036930B47